ncbi:hypothetical protein [Pyxidicoccus xibeiensis]|uniref:hypothetical protein n=1 Tax=Pyxidicoccus xibeiensis TaxID=2906759 RepID=UPI0020A7D92E|nr:hypothetical protein [Pyxidicoccus xibeiensis]MCP3137504.1 hypothetical protein [Pyxidicoccus xibeiensis]
MSLAVLASRSAPSRSREPAPASLVRDSDSVRAPRTRLASERPTSIREAIVRWLDQEL